MTIAQPTFHALAYRALAAETHRTAILIRCIEDEATARLKKGDPLLTAITTSNKLTKRHQERLRETFAEEYPSEINGLVPATNNLPREMALPIYLISKEVREAARMIDDAGRGHSRFSRYELLSIGWLFLEIHRWVCSHAKAIFDQPESRLIEWKSDIAKMLVATRNVAEAVVNKIEQIDQERR